jgi:VWFA-related protein
MRHWTTIWRPGHTKHCSEFNSIRLKQVRVLSSAPIFTMTQRIKIRALFLALAFGFAITGSGQQPSPTPQGSAPVKSPSSEKPGDDQQEPIKVSVEEVQIPIAAYDRYGRLDPTVDLNDVLILENSVRQEARSVRRVPASVLLLLDTGGDINSAKNIRATREIARKLIASLGQQDQISVMQFNGKVELLQDWTSDKNQVDHALDTKLLSGKGGALSPGVSAAVEQFRSQPIGSRHLVLITDGVESASTKPAQAEAIEHLMASNAVLHVISYRLVSRASIDEVLRVVRNRDKSITPDDAFNSLPPDDHGAVVGGSPSRLRQLHKPGGKTFDLDPLRRRQIKQYEEAMIEGELLLTSLSQETGGNISLPESLDQMIDDGAKVAHLIDAEYLVTYRPSRALTTAAKNEIRKLEIVSRRVGLTIVSRRSYVVGAGQ